MTARNPPATNSKLSMEQAILESTRIVQARFYLDEALEVAEHRALDWTVSFSITKYIGLEAGQVFVKPLHQLYRGGSKVSFTLLQAA